jgi:hypothetical protein
MVDRSGRIVLVNREIERLFQYSREELLGRPLEMIIPERFRYSHPESRDAFFREPSVRAMGAGRDLYGRRKDGADIPVEIGLTPVATEEGILVLAAVVDITQRKRAETLFRAAVESSPNGMIMVDRDGRIILVNREVERMFGYDRDELMGRSIDLLVPERLRDGHPASRAAFFSEPSTRAMGAGRDLHGVRKDGTEFPVEIGLNPIETDDGMLVMSSIVDISERKRAEAGRRALEEQLRHSQKMQAVGTLAGGVAHDFNNILAAITAYAELLRDEVPSPDLRADAELILETCQRGKAIVERILSFSRRRAIALRPVSLTDVVKSAETLLRATLPASVRIQVETSLRDHVMADQPSLEQVVMNLGTNGAQAMPHGGVLRLMVEPIYLTDSQARVHPTLGEGHYIALSVEDGGEGIGGDELHRIFEPFYTTKEAGFGTGLGLAVVDGIVAEHGGAVSVESRVGEGTTVRCLFPALDPEGLAGAGRGALLVNPAVRGSGERVLLLDDEPILAVAVERRLRALGYEVVACTTPQAALDAFTADPSGIDIVLTDYSMPDMNGFELAHRITKVSRGVPIVMVTGFVDDLDPDRLSASGIVAVLKKPTTVEEMAAVLRKALGKPA